VTLRETIAALAALPDDAQVTLTLRKRDLLHALQARDVGPDVLTTKQAAKRYGYEADTWRRWAEGGSIDGAYQHAAGAPWRLPRAACEAQLARVRARGQPPAGRPAGGAADVPPVDAGHGRVPPANRSRARGPRQPKGTATVVRTDGSRAAKNAARSPTSSPTSSRASTILPLTRRPPRR